MAMTIGVSSCSKDDDNNDPEIPGGSGNATSLVNTVWVDDSEQLRFYKNNKGEYWDFGGSGNDSDNFTYTQDGTDITIKFDSEIWNAELTTKNGHPAIYLYEIEEPGESYDYDQYFILKD